MSRSILIAMVLVLSSCASTTNTEPYTGPTDCMEVQRMLKTGDTAAFKGSGAASVLSLCTTGPTR